MTSAATCRELSHRSCTPGGFNLEHSAQYCAHIRQKIPAPNGVSGPIRTTYFLVMRDAYRLRYAMIPYLYTASRRAYDEGVSVVRPLYYEYPEAAEAYAATDQYYFGDDMIVSPIATPVDTNSQFATRHSWLPPGDWVEWCTGARFRGPVSLQRQYALEEIPVFVRAGAIVPMQPDMMYTGERPVDPLILTVFPGGNGSVRIYEDEGNSLGYQHGECAWTPVSMHRGADAAVHVTIGPREGAFKGMSVARGYEVRCLLSWPPSAVECNGTVIPPGRAEDSTGWSFDGDKMAVVVRCPVGRHPGAASWC